MKAKSVSYRLPIPLIGRINGIAERMEMMPAFVVEGMLIFCIDKLVEPSINPPRTGAPSLKDDAERIRMLLSQCK